MSKTPPTGRPKVDPVRLGDFIKELGLSYRANNKSYIFTCPLCNKKDKLYISRTSGRFACWVCREDKGFQGAPEFALAELSGLKLAAVREALYGHVKPPAVTEIDIKLENFFDSPGDADEEVLQGELPSHAWPHHCYPLDHEFSQKGVEYLEGRRGISMAVAMSYDIRYSPEQRAVAFPVWVDNQLVGWQYRTILPTSFINAQGKTVERLKIWSSDDIPRDRVVMFQNRLKDSRHVVLCEGPVDALKAHMCGGNVASMGKAVSLPQIEMLARSGVEKVYLALDPDAASEIEPLLRKLGDIPCYLMKVPKPYKDLGEMTLNEVYEVFRTAEPAHSGRIYIFLNTSKLAKLAPSG